VRNKVLKVVLALVGIGILAGNYPLISALVDTRRTTITIGDQMILGLYQPFGVFLLLAIRNPPASRILILAFAWSMITHTTVMTVQAYQGGTLSTSGLGLFIFGMVGVVLLALAPRAAEVGATAVTH
jgi:hypothetical protein